MQSLDNSADFAEATQLASRVGTRVAAVVVLYHPEPAALERLFRSIEAQVSSIFVVDNTPANAVNDSFIERVRQNNVSYISLGDNFGIAIAQNVGIQRALISKHTHVLLMDQDSALPEGMVRELLSTEASLKARGELVAAVGPVFIDEKTGIHSHAIRHSYVRVKRVQIDLRSDLPVESDYIIASGSLISAGALSAIGTMKDELFIDWVDIEWGLRARRLGYKCFICTRTVMRHSLGDAAVGVLGRAVYLHSDLRNYYLVRNAVFLTRVSHMGWQWRSVTAIKIPQYLFFYSYQSDRPIHCFLLLLRALLHGSCGRLGKLA